MKNPVLPPKKSAQRLLGRCRQQCRPLALLIFSAFLASLAGLPALAEAVSNKYSVDLSVDTNRAVLHPSADVTTFDTFPVSAGSLIPQGDGGQTDEISATRMNAMGFEQRAVLSAEGISQTQMESIGSRYGVGGAMSAVSQLLEGGETASLGAGESAGSTLQLTAQAVMSDSNAFSTMLGHEGSLTQVLDLGRVSGSDGAADGQSDSGVVPLSLLGAAAAGSANQQSLQAASGTGPEKSAADAQTLSQSNQQTQPQTPDTSQPAELNSRLVVMSSETETKPAAEGTQMQVDTSAYVDQIAGGGEKAVDAFASFSQSAGYLSAAMNPDLDAQGRISVITEAAGRAEQGMDQLSQAGFAEDSPEYQSGCAIMVLAKAAEYQLPGSDQTSIRSQIESYAAKSGDQKIVAFKDSFLESPAGETEQQATDRRTELLQQTLGETPAALSFEVTAPSQPTESGLAASDDQTPEGSAVAADQTGIQTSTEPVLPEIPAMTQIGQISRQDFREGFAFVRTGLMTSQSAEQGAQNIEEGIQRAEVSFADVGMDDADYQPATQLMGYFYAAGYLTTQDAGKKAEYAAKMKDCAGRVNDPDLEEIVQSALTIDPNVDGSEKTIALLDKIRSFMIGTDETNAQDRGAYRGDTNQAYAQYEKSMDAAYQNYIQAGLQNPYVGDLVINATENTMIAPNVIFMGTATIGADVTIGEINPKEVRTSYNVGPGEELQPQTTIGSNVVIGDGSSIGPGAQIEDGVTLGKNVRIGSNVVVKAGTTVPDGTQILEGTYPSEAVDMQENLLPVAETPQMTQYDLAGSADYVLGQLPSSSAKSSMTSMRSTLKTAQQSATPSIEDVRRDFGDMVGKAQSVADNPQTPADEFGEANNAAVLLICGAMLVDPDPAMQINYSNMLQYFATNAGDQSIQQLGLDVAASGASIHEDEIRQALGW